MDAFSLLRRLYTADVLDTRFVPDSHDPLPLSASVFAETSTLPRKAGEPPKKPLPAGAQVSKWRTPEFKVYYAVFIYVVPSMLKQAYDISQVNAPNYEKFAPLLTDGWIPGRKVDNSDAQYASFRNHLPLLFTLLILHPLLRRLYEYVAGPSPEAPSQAPPKPSTSTYSTAAVSRFQTRLAFDSVFSLGFLFALHGVSAFKVLMILYVNYQIATKLPRQYVTPCTWVFNLFLLFANELAHGFRFADMEAIFSPWFLQSQGSEKGQVLGWGARLDSYGGLLPRWEILFKVSVLRLISFNLDYVQSLDGRPSENIEKKQQDLNSLSERERVDTPLPAQYYAFRTYLLYILYPPLYLAGPIVTYNDYTRQLLTRLPSISLLRVSLYALRFGICLLCMEIMQHYTYLNAITRSDPDWTLYTPYQLGMVGYFSLHFIWLKLLLPWRFFRLWALADGVDPPENMVRCMTDNYSATAFWRGWHRSVNKWIVRYVYIPLGGSGSVGAEQQGLLRRLANMLVVFTFVAIWHDVSLRLLTWGWLVVLFVLPEMGATVLVPRRRWAGSPVAYRFICGFGAVVNMLMMAVANLVGFAIGVEGVKGWVRSMVGSWGGLAFMGTVVGAIFVDSQVMFERREEERRLGLKVKC